MNNVINNAQNCVKNIKKVQKWRKIATFLISTFELYADIRNPTKNRPYGRFCKLWLCSVCSSRAELLEIGREIDRVKDKVYLL